MKSTTFTDLAIIYTIQGLISTTGKNYCWPSQAKLLYLLKEFYGVVISRRTLNYHLRRLEDQGFISRIRRIKRRPDGTLSLSTSLYFLGKKALRLLKNFARKTWHIVKHNPSWIKKNITAKGIQEIEKIPDPQEKARNYLKFIQQLLS
ncbi:MAG: hypothetical protein DRJ03_14815 [Chloroflexi bacterium]|nr:MAG: hypothetical protein DRJ03_14815 [Chloroflexota bacterium]